MELPAQPDLSTRKTLSYQKLVQFIVKKTSDKEGPTTISSLIQFACNEFELDQDDLSESSLEELNKKIKNFFHKFQRKNKKSSYHAERLLTEDWCQVGLTTMPPQCNNGHLDNQPTP